MKTAVSAALLPRYSLLSTSNAADRLTSKAFHTQAEVLFFSPDSANKNNHQENCLFFVVLTQVKH